MRLLDKPLTRDKKDELLRMLDGNIARLCVSDDPEEIISSLGFAIDRLNTMAYSRIKELKERNEAIKVKVVKKEEYMPCSYYCPTCNKQQKDTFKTRREGCYCERCGQKLLPFGEV